MKVGGLNIDKIEVKESVVSTVDQLENENNTIDFRNLSTNWEFKMNSQANWQLFSMQVELLLSDLSDLIEISNYSKGIYILKTSQSRYKIIYQ